MVVNWRGVVDLDYEFYVYDFETTWLDSPGLYIFARHDGMGNWTPLYIGETGSFRDRLPNHEKLPCVKSHGATHVHTRIVELEGVRKLEETDLIKRHNPPCNK